MKVGFITGITGQDGSYLAELLLEKDYTVFGLIRRSSNFNTQRIQHIFENPKLNLRYGDLVDIVSIINILNEIKLLNPNIVEFYNLAAQSHVKVSFELPVFSTQINSIGTLNCLEAIRQTLLVEKLKAPFALCASESTAKLFNPSRLTRIFFRAILGTILRLFT